MHVQSVFLIRDYPNRSIYPVLILKRESLNNSNTREKEAKKKFLKLLQEVWSESLSVRDCESQEFQHDRSLLYIPQNFRAQFSVTESLSKTLSRKWTRRILF